MDHAPPNILQVNTFDLAGGAERISWDLFREYRRRGHAAWLAVGRKRSDDPDVFHFPHHRIGNPWSRACWCAHQHLQPLYPRYALARFLCRATHALAAPAGVLDYWRGREDFNYPGSRRLLDLTPHRPTVLHCHNLHGKYFDLRALPTLSRQIPTFLTLHDAWLLSGHCAHSFDCQRWTTGCGECPDLATYPPIRRDATHANWLRKRDIYARSRFYLAAPCRWLLERAERSILAAGIVESRVIPYGVDQTIFRPGDRNAARTRLRISPEARVLLFAANGIRRNPYKDYTTLRSALERLASRPSQRPIVFLALGEEAPPEDLGRARLHFVPFQSRPQDVVHYYHAADLYVHAARADTFPNTVLEALACGRPVIATAVGGIPEQVTPLPFSNLRLANVTYADGARQPTGLLVRPADPDALAAAIAHLLDNDALCNDLGRHAAEVARHRFDLRRQADDYLTWYQAAASAAPIPITRPPALTNPQAPLHHASTQSASQSGAARPLPPTCSAVPGSARAH